MLFTHDTELTLQFIAELADTAPDDADHAGDLLDEPGRLTELLDRHRYSGRRDGDAAELAQVKAARDRLTSLWRLERDDAVTEVNAILAEANAQPRLERHDGLDWHIHATSPEAPLAERMLVEAAMAFVDVIRADALERLRSCEADDCGHIFVDLSRNASRRFCSTRCGNRMNVRAFRARSAG